MIERTGKLTKVLYKSDDFIIAILETDNEEIKIVGNMYGIEKGNDLTVKGNIVTHPKYGEQLRVEEWKRPIPSTKDQAIAFLSSGLIKGVGKKRAIDIVNQLGENAISIINQEEEKALSGIKGIGKKTAEGIVKSIKNTFEIQEIVFQLKNFGIDANIALKLYKKYESDTVKEVQINPYILADIDGVGFPKADEIARNMGVIPTSGYRINACIKYVLNKLCYQRGHSYIYENELVKETLLALNHNSKDGDLVLEDDLMQSIYDLEEKVLINENRKVYPKHLFEYEKKLARKLAIMRSFRDGETLPFLDGYIKKYQKKNKIILAEKQREAIKRLMEEQVLILTGGPGTGKTTVVKAIINIFKKIKPKSIIHLCAPTGRASKKLEESTGYRASTIHRLIGVSQGELPEYNSKNKLPGDLIIVDESSMLDLQIAYWLTDALKNNAKILFIGDTDQLPSIGTGNVLNDLIESGLPTVKLTEVFRQAEESQIVINAHRINNGKPLLIDSHKGDFYFIKQSNPRAITAYIVRCAMRFIDLGYSLEDMLILSPMRKGDAGIDILNEELRKYLNPKTDDKKELHFGKRVYREGDKVMQNTNNKDKNVFNGEMGIVKRITKEKNEDNKLVDVMYCQFDDNEIKYYKNECNELDLGYAITIHKSQGGEAPIVIMPVTTIHKRMLARNLYYTGVTRAKEKVVLIGTEEAMDIAIRNDKITERNSELDKRIISFTKEIGKYKNQKVKHS